MPELTEADKLIHKLKTDVFRNNPIKSISRHTLGYTDNSQNYNPGFIILEHVQHHLHNNSLRKIYGSMTQSYCFPGLYEARWKKSIKKHATRQIQD